MKKIAALFLFLTFALVGCTGQVGSTGPQGEPGQAGSQGEPGKDGTSLLTGVGAPSDALGYVGDSYIDTETWDYYLKSSSGWIKQGNIKGQDGQTGEAGEEGKSAYDLYCEAHPEYTGTLDEWLDDLVTGKLPTSTHTVTFFVNGTQYGDPVIVDHLGKITPPVDPVRNGYTFAGWENKGELWSFADDVVESDLTLYARWNGNTYHVTFDPAGGVMEQTEADYTCGKYYVFPVPVKEDFKFCGWTFNGDQVSEYWSIAEDCTLVAVWEQTTCQITYDYGYGGLLETVDAPYGEYIDLPWPQRDGYVFLGWSNQEGDGATDKDYFVSDDVKLTAVWKAIPITVTLNTSEGSVEGTTIIIDYGDEFELPVPTGDNFDGWYYGDRQITDEAGKGLAPWDIATSEVALEAFYFIPVYDEAGLRAMSEDLDGNYRLMNDVTLTGEWTPVGTEENPFTGSFDGCSHSIIGLSITEGGGNYLGLFGYFSGLFVSNIDFVGAEIVASYPLSNQDASCAGVVAGYVASIAGADFSGVNVDASSLVSVERAGDRDSYVGGLVGDAFGCTVTSSSNSGSVTGSDSVGGLVGDAFDCTVTSSSNSGSVTGSSDVGGLVGGYFGYSDSLYVESSSNSGDVSGSDYVGGLVGSGGCTISSSSNSGSVTGSSDVGGLVGGGGGTISSSSNSGDVTGSSDVGGLVGYSYEYSTIESSSNSGDVSGSDYVGGLVGFGSGNSVIVSSSSNSGSVNGTGNRVGGLVGGNEDFTYLSIYSSSNVGAVLGLCEVGGLVGYATNIVVDNSLVICDIEVTNTDGSMGTIFGRSDYAQVNNCYYLCTFSYPGGFVGTNNIKGIEISSVAEITKEFFSDTIGWDLSLWDFSGFDPATGHFPTPYLGFKPFGTWKISGFTLTLRQYDGTEESLSVLTHNYDGNIYKFGFSIDLETRDYSYTYFDEGDVSYAKIVQGDHGSLGLVLKAKSGKMIFGRLIYEGETIIGEQYDWFTPVG